MRGTTCSRIAVLAKFADLVATRGAAPDPAAMAQARQRDAPAIQRRAFTGALAGGLLTSPLPPCASCAASAAEATRPPRIGRLSEGGPTQFLPVFRAEMRKLGHPEFGFEDRPARGDHARLPELAAELVGLGVDVIWTVGTVATQAAKDATRSIPIVMVSADALGAGLVKNLARPDANLTGLTLISSEIVGKRLELLKQIDPGVRRIVALGHGPGSADVPVVAEWLRQSRAATQELRLVFAFFEMPTSYPVQWDGEIASLAATRGTALSVMESPFFIEKRELLAELALRPRLPTVFAFRHHIAAGGLFSYGVNQQVILERVAYYVARILDGAKPAALPVEQPTTYELVINAKTARALGLTVPRSVLLRADEVID